MTSTVSVNRVIRALILSDFFLFFGLGLLSPIFAVFILENVVNQIEVIGFAAAAYWSTRVLLVIPLSRVMDRRAGHADEFLFMICGTAIISLVPLGYLLSSEAIHIYLVQALYGLGSSLAVPAWRILFTNYVDKPIMGLEWSLEDVGVGIATAMSAVAGAIVVDTWGFETLFLLIFLFGAVSTLILIYVFVTRADSLPQILRRAPKAPLKIDTIK